MSKGNLIKIVSGGLGVTLGETESGLTLCSVQDLVKKRTLLSEPSELFTLTARAVDTDDMLTISSSEGWGSIQAVSAPELTTIILSENKSLPKTSVILTACCDPAAGKISWITTLASENSEYSLYECDYPALSFDTGEDVMFFYPYGSGVVYGSEYKEAFSKSENYPSYGVSMQYMAFYDKTNKRGIYYGLHDPAPAYKKLKYIKKEGSNSMTLKAAMPLCDISFAGNSQTLCGRAVWQLYDGDWYDAALLYREFVEKEACWLPEMNGGTRTDTAEWMKKQPHWWRFRIQDTEEYADTIIKATEELGVDSAVHIYDWFEIPYDNDYPHYFPAKPWFGTGIKRLQDAGIKVMPYINGRLWDTRDRGMEDWQFSSVAKPNCTKDRHGKPFIETYASKESDGSKVELSIMCPSTALWQEKVTEIIKTLFGEYGVDAVYIDQIAAAAPYMCEDKTHSHQPGGGTWWCESYRNLLDHVNRIVPENCSLTTECTADPFMKNMQGYLTWLWIMNNQVPAFPAVYSGYVTMFGRHYKSIPDDCDEGQKINFAQSLVFGEQMGWIFPQLYNMLKSKDFYIMLVRLKDKLNDYFYNGQCLRPPVATGDMPVLFTDKSTESPDGIIRHQAVFTGLWRKNDDEKKLLLLVNASDETVECDLECVLPDGDYVLLDSEGNKTPLSLAAGKGRLAIGPETALYSIII